jgi:CheY-like chemotaxis protein
MHGGVIEAHSEGLGRGSEFIARLPLLAAAETEAQSGAGNGAVASAQIPSRQELSLARGKRVLVVDDNVDTARSMGRLLTKRGFEVSLAYDGPSGEQAAREFAPEICLLDIGLPGFDGYELARRLRAGGPCQDALIVAISGYAQEGDRQRSRVAGFDAHLAKPVDLDKLFDLMAELVAK